MKTDPRPYSFVFIGTASMTVAAEFEGLTVLNVSGGEVTRAGTPLSAQDTLSADDVLTVTPAVSGGTTTLSCEMLDEEFSGLYNDLGGKPSPSGGTGAASMRSLDGMQYSTGLSVFGTPVRERTDQLTVVMRVPTGTRLDRVEIGVAGSADLSTFDLRLSNFPDVSLVLLGTVPLVLDWDTDNVLAGKLLATFGIPNGPGLTERMALTADSGNPPTITVTGTGLLNFDQSGGNTGAVKVSVKNSVGSDITLYPLIQARAGGKLRVWGNLATVVSSANQISAGTLAILDNGNDAPQWAYRSGDGSGVLWLGPSFTLQQ